MSSRDVILGRVRQALRDVPDAAPDADVPVDWSFGRPVRLDGDVLDVFVERVVDYRAVVVRCGADEVGVRIVEAATVGRPLQVEVGGAPRPAVSEFARQRRLADLPWTQEHRGSRRADSTPEFLRLEPLDLELAVADESQRHRLHAAS